VRVVTVQVVHTADTEGIKVALLLILDIKKTLQISLKKVKE
jgi:hypothetical protein